MKKKILLLFLAALIVGAISYLRFFKNPAHPDTLILSGTIEATQARLGFQIPGRLFERLADEGDFVSKDQIIARLDNKDQTIAVSFAQANLDQARALLAELESGSRPEEIRLAGAKADQAKQKYLELTNGSRPQEIEAAKAELAYAQAAEKSAVTLLAQAKSDAERYESLFKEHTASERDRDLYATRYRTAEYQVNEARARVAAARQNLSLLKEGPRKEQIQMARHALEEANAYYDLVLKGPRDEKIDLAKAQVKAAGENLNQALQLLSHTELKSPMDGIVLSKSAEPGEYLNPGSPVLNIGDVRHPWLRAYVNETDLGIIKLKQEIKVSTDAFPERQFNGVITFISSQAEFTPKSVQTFEERVKLVYRIHITLENPDLDLKPGMPADAFIPRSQP